MSANLSATVLAGVLKPAGFEITRQQHRSLFLDEGCAQYHATRYGGQMAQVFTADQQLITQALRIADQACEEIVLSEGVDASDDARAVFTPTDARGREVSALCHASESFQMAVGWLVQRKRADFIYDECGVRVLLLTPTTHRVQERTA